MEQTGPSNLWMGLIVVLGGGLLLAVLSAWFYLGTDIFLVYLEQGLSYCL